jgi:hypothetical protein
MSAEYDVETRSAEGRSAVDDFTEYVGACRQLGHPHPELTRLGEQYAAEQGLELSALEADAAALATLAAAADDAVRQQAELVAGLSDSWIGTGASAALDFLRRHHRSAAGVAAALHEAAGALAELREELWRAVDEKVATTLAIDERTVGRRAAWLAAARTVATGSGDRSVASELIEQQVEPFVANDIRGDWLAAVQVGTASVTAAYDAAIARLGAGSQPSFEIPGAWGQWVAPVDQRAPAASGFDVAPVRDSAPVPVGASAGVVPAAAVMAGTAPVSALGAPAPMGPESAPLGQPIPSASTAAPGALGSELPGLGGMPGLGSGAPGLGGMGPSGFGQQLSDLIGGLVGASADAAPELSEVDPPELGQEDESDPSTDEDSENDEADENAEDESEDEPEGASQDAVTDDSKSGETVDAAVESSAGATDEAEAPPPVSVPTPVGAELGPAIPPAELEAAPEPKTPCEIAADELPQLGDEAARRRDG